MSSEAWEDYGVPGSPYFVLVQDGAIRGEGVATTWSALTSLVSDAVEEQRGLDERLAAAGIGPDHPSLYPEARRLSTPLILGCAAAITAAVASAWSP